MPDHAQPANALSSAPLHARWRGLRRSALALSLLLGACGGGGGGGGNTALEASSTTSSVAFPFGVSWAPATDLSASSDVPSGAMGVQSLSLSTTDTPAQALASGQVDAIASGRVTLSGSGWLQPTALFDTTLNAHATCWSPAVAYANHDDSPSSTGTLSAGEVGLWIDHVGSDTTAPCAVAEVSTQVASLSAQAHQAMLLLSALRWKVYSTATLGMPAAGQRIDLTTVANTLFQGLLGDASVVASSVSANSDGSEQDYRLVLTRGSGATAQTLEMTLLHTPADTDTHYAGALQIALSYLSTDASLGCTDQRDNASRYKVARLLTLGYNRQDEWMSLRARSGLYCGNGSLLSASQIADLASLTLSGELDPGMYVSGSTRGSTAGWHRHFLRWSSDHLVSAQTSDFLLAWQPQPQAGAGHARLLAGHTTLDTSSGIRTLMIASGHTEDISVTDGNLLGLICNVSGPGANGTLHSAFQLQQASLSRTGTAWVLTDSHQRTAPTNSCNASANMRFDLDGNGTLDAAEGEGTQSDLITPSQNGTDPQDELNLRGFLSPVLLL